MYMYSRLSLQEEMEAVVYRGREKLNNHALLSWIWQITIRHEEYLIKPWMNYSLPYCKSPAEKDDYRQDSPHER
jgi:hypothetical protein